MDSFFSKNDVSTKTGQLQIIAANTVVKAVPDGYTLLLNTSALAINPSIYRKLPFDALKDFAALSQLVSGVLTQVVNSNVPAKSVTELIALYWSCS